MNKKQLSKLYHDLYEFELTHKAIANIALLKKARANVMAAIFEAERANDNEQ